MACACTQRKKQKFLWYDPARAESVEPVIYNSEIEAKAKIIRESRKGSGGRFIPYNAEVPIGTQIAAAEAAAKARLQVTG